MTGLLRPCLKLDTSLPAIFILSLTALLPGNNAKSDPLAAPSGVVGQERTTLAPEQVTAPPPDRVAPLGEHGVVPSVPAPAQEAVSPPQNCDTGNTIVYSPGMPQESSCPGLPEDALQADRAYLVETATPGYTMTRQGPEVAIERLNPKFVHRLAGAIREARQAGLSSVGIFSAYRPPAFGVGGFSNKFNSLHTYGLAVDMTGIGAAGSEEAKSWYEIAARHNIVCPYGVDNHTEWNHCQPTKVKIIVAENPLRETVTADGPIDLESMFQAGTALIERSANEPDSEHPEMAHVEIERRNSHAAELAHLEIEPRNGHAAEVAHVELERRIHAAELAHVEIERRIHAAEQARLEIERHNSHAAALARAHPGRANHALANHEAKSVRLMAHLETAKTQLAHHKLKLHPQNEKA